MNEEFGHDKEVTSFLRSGKSGNWKKHLTKEMEQKFDAWEKKWLEGSNFKFDYGDD